MLMLDDEILAVVTAFKEGKQIQFFDTENSEWVDCIGHPAWDFNDTNYRAKPEKKLRPYASADEFLEAQQEHGLYIFDEANKEKNEYILPVYVNDELFILKGNDYLYEDVIDGGIKLLWQDKTPLGVEVIS